MCGIFWGEHYKTKINGYSASSESEKEGRLVKAEGLNKLWRQEVGKTHHHPCRWGGSCIVQRSEGV